MPSKAQREKKEAERRNTRIARIEFELAHGDALKAQDGGCYVMSDDGSIKLWVPRIAKPFVLGFIRSTYEEEMAQLKKLEGQVGP